MTTIKNPTKVEIEVAQCIISSIKTHRDNPTLGLDQSTKVACELIGQDNLYIPVYLAIRSYAIDAHQWADQILKAEKEST